MSAEDKQDTEPRVYGPAQRFQWRWTAALFLALVLGLPSFAALAALRVFDVAPTWHPYLVAGVIVVTFALFPFAAGRASLFGNGWLRRRLAAKIATTDEGQTHLAEAVFVGFSPAEPLLAWQGDTDWDVGFLRVAGEMLVYWGDRCRWSLPRSAVRNVNPGPESELPRVLIFWRADVGEHGVVSLTPRDVASTRQLPGQRDRLFARLQLWLADEEAQGGPFWGFPPTGAEGGRPVGRVTAWGCLAGLALLTIAITTWLLVSWPKYLAGQHYVAMLEALALGLPTLVVIGELMGGEGD